MNINAKIKDLRLKNGYTLEKLSEITGFTKGYLSKIERSAKTPPFATVQSIAAALKADITELMDARQEMLGSKNIEVLKYTDAIRDGWEKSSEVYSFKPLVNTYRNKYMSPFLFMVKKGTSELTAHDSEEFVYVLEGNVELNYEGKTYRLGKGDCFYLDARIKHNFQNTKDETALLMAVHFNYRRF